ncbi:MAG: hypothetical protein M3Q03_10720 [Chloroflexota bacterium]|nr:hypothetical protein [Chloroflexota bacterium]
MVGHVRPALGLTRGNPFAPFVIGTLVVTGLAAAGVPVALSLGAYPMVVWTLAVTAGSVLALFLAVFVVAARRGARDVSRLRAGEVWTRWRYDTTTAERLVERERSRTRTSARQTARSGLLAGIVAGVSAGYGSGSPAIGAILGALYGGVLLLLAAVWYVRSRQEEGDPVDHLGEAVIGPGGLDIGGRYASLRGAKVQVLGVEMRPGQPSVLRFDLLRERRTTADDWWEFSHRYWAKTYEEVAIPAGREAEAGVLVDRFRQEFNLKA